MSEVPGLEATTVPPVPGTEGMTVLPQPAQRRLGESTSTGHGYKAALKVVNYCLTKILRLPPMHELTTRHVEEDNLQNLLLKIAIWMAQTPIPAYSDDNLESTVDPPKYVTVSTLKEYLSKAKETLKNKIPQHKDWKDESWWIDLRAGFDTEATRQQFRGDDVFGDRATRSLYTTNRPGLSEF